MSQQTQSQLDQPHIADFIKKMIAAGETNAGIVNHLWASQYRLSTTKDSIRRFRKRHQLLPPPAQGRPGIRYDGEEADVTGSTKLGLHMDDPDAMLRERKLNPEEWLIDSATVNEWDGPSQEGPVTYHQAKIHIKRKRPELQLLPARSDGWIAPPRKRAATKGTKLIAVVGDQQCPYYDENLHYLFCGWLEENQPDEIVFLGDTVDYPEISRHRLDPENTATVNECTQSGYDLLRGVRVAAPNALIRKLAGNHDERLRNILLDKPSVQPLYGAKQADSPEEKGAVALGLPFLLRLDELGIEYIEPAGSYDLAQINLSDKLAVRHGWIARQGSGASALATLEHLGYCVPLESEILTARGWKKHDEVEVGDETIGYNTSTRKSEWTKVEKIHHFDSQPIEQIGHSQWSVLATPNHRWAVDQRYREGDQRNYRSVFKTQDTLVDDDRLIIAAPFVGDEQSQVEPFEAALVAWIWTDGSDEHGPVHLGKRKSKCELNIWQSKFVQVETIRDLLISEEIPHSEYAPRDDGLIQWRIKSEWGRDFWERMGLYELSPVEFVLSLSRPALESFVHTCWEAEGWMNGSSTYMMAQNRGPVCDALVIATFLLGYRPSITSNGGNNVNIARCVPHITGGRIERTPKGSVPVWCVETGLGSWTMRQGDVVTLTGNSVIVGHTHRQSIIYKTTHDIDGAITTLTAAEAGCMCRVDQTPIKGRKWPNFTPLPDWVQGFTTAVIHSDQTFRLENATYIQSKGNGILLWRDQGYR